MSKMKELVMDIMELWEEGLFVDEIAKRLQVDEDTVRGVVEEYSNFYDY